MAQIKAKKNHFSFRISPFNVFHVSPSVPLLLPKTRENVAVETAIGATAGAEGNMDVDACSHGRTNVSEPEKGIQEHRPIYISVYMI